MTTTDELEDALEQAEAMPHGDGKIAELERIVAHADAAELTRVGFDARMELIESYERHTESWRLVPVFSWCLRTFDTHPELFDDWDAELIRWYHKWAVLTLCDESRVGLAQTQAAMDDLERRYREGGHSLQAVHALRCRIAAHLGEQEQARQWLDQWRTARRDENSDCLGCDPSRQAELLSEWGDWEAAIAAGEVAMRAFNSCDHQPERALAALMVPYLRLGRHSEAGAAHVRSYRRHRQERDSFGWLSDHLLFCAVSGNAERGLEILAEHLGWLDRPHSELSAMEFAAAGALVCRLAAEAGLADQTLHRPEHGQRPAAEVPVAALGEELAAFARDLAGRFDARNGNTYQSSRIEDWLAQRPVPDPVELPAEGTRSPSSPEGQVGDPEPTEPGPMARQEIVAPLTVEGITAVLDERGDRYAVSEDGVVAGVWDQAQILFRRTGEQGEVLHSLVRAQRQLPSDRRADAYAFCNDWNRDTLFPKVYVHDTGEGALILAGEVNTDLEPGVSPSQLAALMAATLATGTRFAEAVEKLP